MNRSSDVLWACITAAVAAFGCVHASAAEPSQGVVLESFEGFAASSHDWLPGRLARDAKLWRQVAPSVWWLLRPHADTLRTKSVRLQSETATAAADFVVRIRTRFSGREVIAPGRPIVALLDPDRGLDRRQITALATAYGATAEVFKRDGQEESLESVASAWLDSVSGLVGEGRPGTVLVVGHGLPREIQSYHVPVDRLAATLEDAAAKAGREGRSPGEVVLIFDDCFSADFCLNLAGCLETLARARGVRHAAMPVMIAGANRNQFGHVDVGEKFVTHFWDVVIELYYVRTPRPRAITLGDFLGPIDNAMYGFGRAPIVEGGRVTGYRMVNAELVQDPVCFVPLEAEEIGALRQILGLSDAVSLLPILDAG